MTIKIPGIIAAPLTPFNQELVVDYKKLESEIDYVVDVCQPGAVAVAAVETQEYQYLTYSQRLELIQRTSEFVGGRCATVVGVSHPSVRTVSELIRKAEQLNADAVQVLAPLRPFGGVPTQQETLDYFKAVAKESSLPIVVYLNPGPGADIPPDTVLELAKLDQVGYFKESSRDLRRVGNLVLEIEKVGHAHYLTTMEMLLPTLLLGGKGADMPTPATAIGRRVVKAFTEGNVAEASKWQSTFHVFPGRWAAYGLAPIMKLAMKQIGMDMGDPYPPFRPVPASKVPEFAAALESIGLQSFQS